MSQSNCYHFCKGDKLVESEFDTVAEKIEADELDRLTSRASLNKEISSLCKKVSESLRIVNKVQDLSKLKYIKRISNVGKNSL